ncbi:MAG: acetyl-CoA carboxylase biotin carboxyl carrier protein [Deltaproteobacteria bacterium]|nr:acetyl-CoA carboxylase biotin carboxyl carrier protein [Deltaproteobacteria bacterium]
MEIDDIRKLVALMAESDVVELEMENRKGKIRLVRGNHHAPTSVTVVSASAPPQQLAPITVSTSAPLPSVSVPPPQTSPTEAPVLEQGIPITSPMVGTFYQAPSPDAKPYVEIGTVVEKGDVVCIIEAMKMMNEIQAEARGRVLKILVENGQPIGYEQPLFLLELL